MGKKFHNITVQCKLCLPSTKLLSASRDSTSNLKKHPEVYIVMELCEKGDLSNYITENGALEESSSCRLFKQLCEALQYLHNMDVAHRDLKCENLLLDTHSNLKVCDFGFSKRLSYIDGQMALSKTFCGTTAYAAPEILKSFPYNPKVSDVWSMGVVLYMMLYACVPFSNSNVTKMVRKQMEHRIYFPKIPPVSFEAKDLIYRILHPVVEQRITTGEILQNSWILQGGKTEDSDEASASNAGFRQQVSPKEQTKEGAQLSTSSSDAEEGPSAVEQR